MSNKYDDASWLKEVLLRMIKCDLHTVTLNTIKPDVSYTYGNKIGGIEISNLNYEPRAKRKFNIGHDSDEPCDVCGKVGDCQSDSWFCYTVCEEHSEMSPQEVSKIRRERR